MSSTPRSALAQRALTAGILAPLGILAVLLLPTVGFALLLGSLCALGMREWVRMAGPSPTALRIALFGAGIALMLVLGLQHRELLRQVSLVGLVFWCLAPLWLRAFEFGSLRSRRYTLLKLVAGLLVIVPAWCAGVYLHGEGARGPLWVLFVVVLIWCADVFAYFTGRRFGGRKLAPRISPGKTWAGVYGAFGGAVLYAAICGYALGLRGPALLGLIVLSLLTVALSIVGDLFESLIKRHAGAKDSGSLLPGHGGVLDRFDSLFAALPVFVAGKMLLGL